MKQCMRGEAAIEYVQTGLEYTLYACEVWFNYGLCQIKMGRQSECLQSFVKAHEFKRLLRHDIVDEAMNIGWKDFLPFPPPDLLVFRPRKINLLSGSSLLGTLSMDMNMAGPSNSETSSRKIVAVEPGEYRPSLVDFGRLSRPSSLCFTSSNEYEGIRESKIRHIHEESARLIKLKYWKEGVEIIKFTELPQNCQAEELLAKIQRKTGNLKVRVKFADSQGDWVSLIDDYDLAMAIEQSYIHRDAKSHELFMLCCY